MLIDPMIAIATPQPQPTMKMDACPERCGIFIHDDKRQLESRFSVVEVTLPDGETVHIDLHDSRIIVYRPKK